MAAPLFSLWPVAPDVRSVESCARRAVEGADALIAELNLTLDEIVPGTETKEGA